MKLVFMGTPEFALVTLKALVAAGHDIVCVYSQPPRPAGRGQNLRLSPVHKFAVSKGIEVRTPFSLKSVEEQKTFAALKADAAVVVAYGLILPLAILNAPRVGCFNVHASLLPRWRGAAPIQRAIMAGDAESGVTIMRMELGLDTGPMMKVGHLPITAETTASSLHDELAVLGANLMIDVLKHPENAGTPQPAEGVTYATKIDKAEAKIDFSKSAVEVRNHIHGLSPFPGAWCILVGSRVKILKAKVVDHVMADAPTFACGSGAIKFLLLQREGRDVMDAATFLRGFPIAPGTKPT
ncbi:MAG TPA: methionyl-tRNA formyltransferase [Aestuariivirga sp.]